MGRIFTLDDLQKQFDQARESLSRERAVILSQAPIEGDINPDSYGFSYLRAERLGMEAILSYLESISWLPMQIDPKSEILLENKNAMTKWLASAPTGQPDSSAFGNDFIHALTRVALAYGWQSVEFQNASLRLGKMFHDLSCLIGLIYYGVWMAENGIIGVPVSDPYDLETMAREITHIMNSPEITKFVYERRQAMMKKKTGKEKPKFQVIHNDAFDDPSPSPVH